jgi:tetratricopeptide (TPR) repeat protein
MRAPNEGRGGRDTSRSGGAAPVHVEPRGAQDGRSGSAKKGTTGDKVRSSGSRWLALAALVAAVAAGGGNVRAEPTVIDAELAKRVGEIDRAKGPEVYAALRGVLDLWDLADPTQVEAELTSFAASERLAPPVRVYAQMLVAEARKRRGDAPGAAAIASKLGFVDKWLFVGPFDNENRGGLARAFQPEQELAAPIVPGRAFDGKERPVRFRDAAFAGSTVFDFGAYLRPRENVCGYATTFLRSSPRAKTPRKVSLWVGATGAVKVFQGAELVLADEAYRELDVDRLATTITLGQGPERITVKVCSDATSPKFSLRVGDDKGAPDLDVVASADPALSVEGAPAADAKEGPRADAPRGDKPPKKKEQADRKPAAEADPRSATKTPSASKIVSQGSLLGPIQAFERAVGDGSKASAGTMEAYARYLVSTGGDPRGEHRARELAQRAAEAEPTVQRLLLAGDLSEDRNQLRGWIERAEKLAQPNDVDVLLARARLTRTGIQWRDAVPFYEKVLAIEPDNLIGTLGRVDLYVQAGLPRTALATLDAAVATRPRSVALLKAYATELRLVGRETEADEIDARWFAFRADDTSFASRQIDLAVARRDVPGAERWLSRFTANEGDGVFAASVAARTYRALGQKERARRALEAALDAAPEDLATLRSLADLAGQDERREEQLRLLRKLLALSPQSKDVREYVEHIEPAKPRDDEAYAWEKDRFLKMRDSASARLPRRTLRNLTVTTIFPNGLARHFHQIVFQPLTDEGAARARQYSFSFRGDKQDVELRTARVYRADGSVAEAVESGEGAANDPSIAMYTSERTFYVQFPRLSPGDVVELRYRVDDVAQVNEVADAFSEIEYVQADEPIADSEYVVIAPKTKKLSTFVSGMPGMKQETTDKGDQRVYHFTATDVPALEPEPAMPPWSEVLGQVHVSTFQSWDELGAWYWGLARDQLDVDDEVRKKVRELTQGLTTDDAKIKAVYRYVTSLRYVGLELGIEGIKPRRCALTLARGWGDCKDKATMIVTMLRELGIPSTIVLVRTGMRGDLPKGAPATIAAFDHAIAYVPSLDLYLDGTADGAGSTELPAMDRGSVGLQINEGKPKLVRLPDPPAETSPHDRRMSLTLAADGSSDFSLDMTVRGANAVAWRERYHGEGTRRDRATRDLAGVLGAVELAKGEGALVVRDVDDVEKPVGLSAKGRATAYARREGDRLSVPVASPLDLTKTLASLSSRKLDLSTGALTRSTDERTIKLPPGMKIERLPEPVKLDSPYGKVELTADVQSGKVVVRSSIALKKSRIAPVEYAQFRAFCEAADNALGQRLVLAP